MTGGWITGCGGNLTQMLLAWYRQAVTRATKGRKLWWILTVLRRNNGKSLAVDWIILCNCLQFLAISPWHFLPIETIAFFTFNFIFLLLTDLLLGLWLISVPIAQHDALWLASKKQMLFDQVTPLPWIMFSVNFSVHTRLSSYPYDPPVHYTTDRLLHLF